jgi:8-oxo-dGTP pyrophosphatase MutT (NUDIX family)
MIERHARHEGTVARGGGGMPVTPLPAATVALVRDAGRGLEVLLLQRNLDSGFVPGAHVFPGGGVDEGDHAAGLWALCAGVDDAAASRVLGMERGGLAYWVAAIRETFEEAGILLACEAEGGIVVVDEDRAGRLFLHRSALDSGATHLAAILRAEQLRLAADRLVYFSRWVTPEGLPRRYDTRFFLALAPPAQEAAHCNRETIAHAWMRPAEALDRHARAQMNLRTPTLKTLELFAQFGRVEALARALSDAA